MKELSKKVALDQLKQTSTVLGYAEAWFHGHRGLHMASEKRLANADEEIKPLLRLPHRMLEIAVERAEDSFAAAKEIQQESINCLDRGLLLKLQAIFVVARSYNRGARVALSKVTEKAEN